MQISGVYQVSDTADSGGLVPSVRTFGTTLMETVPGAEFTLFLLD